ncbi:MAG TPA: lysophospholipid acyltransferase family protein [Vicinamibacterales bacterium]|nr:lysophospholipid acyltransferase family protein [Vicinamibacterales bacterium]
MVVAAIRTASAVLVVALWVLVAGPPTLIWTLLSRRPRLIYAAGSLGVCMGAALSGIRVVLTGREHLQPGAAVYACNHSSNVEPPAVFLALRPLHPALKVLYKAEMRRLPVLVWVFDVAGFVPVARGNREQSFGAVDRAADGLGRGDSFFIFPEGTRSRTGDLLPFKKGGFVMAIKAQVPVVPVSVSGGRAAMRKGSALIWPTTITVRLGAPVPTRGLAFDDRDALVEQVRHAIRAGLPGA